MHLIVGLGNPGVEYENTRHNLGFKVIDALLSDLNVSSLKSKHDSLLAQAKIDDHKIIILKPQTFMNNSGLAVGQVLNWYKIKPENLILIYDDVDLEVGQLRLREKGGTGGHNGVESVIQHVSTTEFARVRIGIGRDNLLADISDYVLGQIPNGQAQMINEAVNKAAEAVKSIVTHGINYAMNQFNISE
ncbi:MAG: aminoacyl-tRNA hydrolase [Candidatus Margulisbacteria bacterium]|nr:aminoacyl-tRNA hydrolase [Candidatus Margulisiibacteriota bacterium]